MCAALALRLFILANNTAIEIDGISYATMGDQISKGHFGQALGNVFSPMYPVFIGLFHLVVPDLELAGRLVSLVSGMLVVYLSFLFARRLMGSGAKALLVAFLIAFQPHLVRYSGQVLSESLATLLFTLTAFCFYIGWQEDRRFLIGFSGFCLVLAYLTRPEYLVYFAPLVLLLLWKRRIAGTVALLLPFVILGCLYIGYLHMATGLWIISKKATLSPFVPFGTFLATIPFVCYEFFIALFPPFLLLAVLGYKRVNGRYRMLVVLLTLFHILSLSFISHSTKRYSVELIPICTVFGAEGILVVSEYAKRFMSMRAVWPVLVVLIVFFGVFQSYTPIRHDRGLHKEAGLFLLKSDPGSVIASRLPIIAFYAHGQPVSLMWELRDQSSVAGLDKLISEKKVKYLTVDEETERDLGFLKTYISRLMLVREFTDDGSFVRIYKTGQTP
jgi:hypothetical protein